MRIIKRILILASLFFVVFLVACDTTTNTNNNTNHSNDVITINVGDTIKLNSSIEDCTWSSSNTSVASITSDGVLYGLSKGVSTVSAKKDNLTKEVQVNVVDNEKVVSISVSGKQTIKVGEETTLVPTIYNSLESYTYTFTSNDEEVATVDESGVVKGINSGICTITVKAIASTTIEKEVFIYVKSDSEEDNNINNVINNITYEVIGSFDLSMINEKVVSLVNKYKESIVGVSNYQTQIVSTSGGTSLVETSVGTGFIFKVEGTSEKVYYVLTNYHVVKDNEKLKIYFGYDDVYVDALYVEGNDKLDLAVVKFTSTKDYVVIPLGDTKDVNQGDFAVAIGNANGYEYFGSVTFGAISFINRKLVGEEAVFLQHDVAINPGNSGGPLFSLDGKVIGVNTLKIVDTDIDNMGFSISIDVVKNYLQSIGLY